MPSTKELSNSNSNSSSSSRSRALLSKDNIKSTAGETGETGDQFGETSFRVYYGATGAAIPFMWESQPGTPKHPMFNKSREGSDETVPPLTPPPSYTTSTVTNGHISHKRRKSRIFDVILSSLSRKNSNVSPTSSSSSPLSWSTTSSSSSSSISSPRGRKNNDKMSHRRSISFCSFGAKSPLFGDEIHDVSNNNNSIDLSPNSAMMCFGFKKKNQGCYSMQDMKNAIFSIKGH